MHCLGRNLVAQTCRSSSNGIALGVELIGKGTVAAEKLRIVWLFRNVGHDKKG